MIGDPLAPWTPPDAGWTRADVQHLLRRTGFDPGPDEVRAALASSPDAVIAARLDPESTQDSERARNLDVLGPRIAAQNNIADLRGWWVQRMRWTDRPLHARMAMFWHDHFATSFSKVERAPLMLEQLRRFEQHALGSFRDLVLAVARDPAMIIWLDGNENIKGRPNENWARELLELFALGVGAYSERDIKAAARAFTGWHQRNGRFRFVAHAHDDTPVDLLGARGVRGGEAVIDVVLAQPACARFLATKLLREFVTPDPSDALIEAFARRLRVHDLHIGRGLGELFRSRAMFASAHRRTRIKSPAEFLVGLARVLEVMAPARQLGDGVAEMGQRLFEPPTVAGWDHHRGWLNAASLLVRLNGVARLCESGPGVVDFDDFADSLATDDVPASMIDLLLDGEAPSAVTDRLAALPARGSGDAARETLRLIASSPEFQFA